MAATALVQLWLARHYFGFLTGDDVEVLAAAFRSAFGFEYSPWDVRNLFVPEVVIAPLLRFANAVGVVAPARLIEIASLPFIALNALTIWLVFRLAKKWSEDDLAAIIAASLFALHWLPLMFGATVYPRTIAAACIVGAALLVSTRDSRGAALLAGALAGIAFADRFSEIVFLAPMVILSGHGQLRSSAKPSPGFASSPSLKRVRTLRGWVAAWGWASARPGLAKDGPYIDGISSHGDGEGSAPSGAARDRYGSFVPLRMTLVLIGAAVAILLTVGAYDWISWGAPFATVRSFAKLTLVEPDFSSRVKYQSPWWYLETLPRWCALTMLPLLYAARKRAHLTFVFIPLVALSLIKHKELRYVQGLVPFLAIAAGIGFATWWRADKRKLAVALLAISLIWNLYGLRYIERKSMPAVMAARMLAEDPLVRTVVLSQIWAYGDRLYFTDRRQIRDVQTPPRDLAAALPGADAVSLYESDLTPAIEAQLQAAGFGRKAHFDSGAARAVVVYTADHGQR
ncbi:MAG: hypothetical protein JOZ54_21770 [Acidobacteria bacterium]|nr:hypothetical protein [Acidobacteriota bacterium]